MDFGGVIRIRSELLEFGVCLKIRSVILISECTCGPPHITHSATLKWRPLCVRAVNCLSIYSCMSDNELCTVKVSRM